jgi:ferrous iron transport protein B
MTVAGIWGVILHRTVFKGELSLFVLELPPYRIPTIRMLTRSVWSKVKTYLIEAGTIITATMVIVWALLHLPYGVAPEKTVLGITAKTVAPLFEPLGFGNRWESVAAILPGFVAKEVVIGALGQMYVPDQQTIQKQLPPPQDALILTGKGLLIAAKDSLFGIIDSFVPSVFRIEQTITPESPLYDAIRKGFTPISAMSFMVFNLLLVSCVATMGAVIQEFGRRHLVTVILLTTCTAYSVAWLVFTIGSIILH